MKNLSCDSLLSRKRLFALSLLGQLAVACVEQSDPTGISSTTPSATDTAASGTSAAPGISSAPAGSTAPGASMNVPDPSQQANGVPSPERPLPAPQTDGVAKPSGAPEHLTVLDWAGFKAAMSFTFDDSNSSQIAHYAELQALGTPFTFYLITGKSDSSKDIWAQALLDGHELGNHTKTHADTDDGTDTDLATQFILDKFGVTTWTMAAPYGADVYSDIAESRFLINRGVSDSLIAANDSADPFTLPCYIPPEDAEETAYEEKADAALAAGKWQVVLVHGFTGGSDGAYQAVPIEGFVAGVKYIKELKDVWLGTVAAVGAYWRAQVTFNGVEPVVSGTDTTWTWTLPDHFPPGQHLRVTVDGGTLKQRDTVLEWDTHGYYEVALDAKTLTLTP